LYEHVALQVAKELVQIVPVYIQRHYHKRMRIERLIIAFLLRTVQGCHPR
jgi:cyanophycinase-like exopeptidase